MPDTLPEPNAATALRAPSLKPGHTAIVGLQWGDEGKGKVVDLLTSLEGTHESARFDVVARYNGGANAGHTVVVGDKKYALHLIPSGILHEGRLNVLGNGVVVDPEQVVKEITGLREQGLTLADNFKISDRCHVVMPYHKTQDALQEAAYVLPNAMDQTVEGIGTTGRGIGPCYADKALRSTAVRMADLLDLANLERILHRIVPIKNATLGALAEYAGEAFTPTQVEDLMTWLRPLAETLGPHIANTSSLLHGRHDAGQRILFEGGNATLLDVDHGTYPYVTSSNCSSLGVHAGTGVPGHAVPNVLGIVKAYQTRVGGGPMPTELHDDTGEQIRQAGREFGTTTGRPRRCGWIDLVALRYTARLCGATAFTLMLLDVLSGFDELNVCTAYDIHGQRTDIFPGNHANLAAAKPIYETLPGFSEPVDDARRFEELPAAAQAYVRHIEDAIGIPAVMISVGPKRDQTIVR
ncbi:MAG: adenylosuccinate synthase [Planctomycetota bacterium]